MKLWRESPSKFPVKLEDSPHRKFPGSGQWVSCIFTVFYSTCMRACVGCYHLINLTSQLRGSQRFTLTWVELTWLEIRAVYLFEYQTELGSQLHPSFLSICYTFPPFLQLFMYSIHKLFISCKCNNKLIRCALLEKKMIQIHARFYTQIFIFCTNVSCKRGKRQNNCLLRSQLPRKSTHFPVFFAVQ